MKNFPAFWIFFLASALGTWHSLAANDLSLARDGQSPYRILLPAEASPAEQNAAAELQTFFEQITGARLPILKDGEASAPAAPLFFVGTSEAAKTAFPALASTEFKPDEILIQSDASGNVLLTGHPQRGTLYAVVTFLEDALGCRWWTSEESTIPHSPSLTIPAQNHRYAPALVYRESFYRDAFEKNFAVRSRCNGSMAQIPEEWGGHHRFAFFVHSIYRLIPPVKYFKDHPDWFPEIDGVRKVGIPGWVTPDSEYEAFEKTLDPSQIHAAGTQLCFTNDEMRKELTKNALEYLRNHPESNFISISQNDWHGNCTCAKCRALDEANESPAGSLIAFVNQVAEEIEKEFPNVYVETLAYQYSRKPPKLVKPRRNVVVRLCTIECSFLQPLETGELNRSLADDLRGWSAISPQLFVWNYITNFSNYLLPHPNMRVLAPNIRFFVKNHTIGLFDQGDSFTTCGDFVAARNWVVSHLLWNPDQDEQKLWDEFFSNYYGAAGPILQDYLRLLHDRADSTDFNLRCFLPDTKGWLDPETMLKSTVIAQRARQAVEGNAELTLRVNRALTSFDFNWLKRWHELNLYCKLHEIHFPGPANPRQAAEKLLAFLEAQGTRAHREAYATYDWNQFKTELLNQFPPQPAADPDLTPLGQTNPDWKSVTWLDFQDSAMNVCGREKAWGDWVDDPKASDGRAIRMPGWHYEWAASLTLPKGIDESVKKWHVYASVRCEATAAEGLAMTCGIYDTVSRKGLESQAFSVPAINGAEYHLVDLGVHELTDHAYVWFAPPKRPEEVQNVFVDRFFLLKAE